MQQTNDNTSVRKYNIKLFIIYKMLSSDLLFYYAIDFLFLTQIKGISAASVVLADSIYTIFRLLFQIPCAILADKIGKKTSLIIANIALAIYMVLIIFCVDMKTLIIANVFAALSFTIKGICGPAFLYDMLPEGKERGSLFSKINGKGTSYYYYLYAVSSIISGFLFLVNGYIPMILSLVICIYSIYLVFKIKDTGKESRKLKDKVTLKSQISDIKYSFIYFMKSKRLSSLLLFYSVVSGFMVCFSIYRKSVLSDLNISSEYFGIIFAVLGVISAIAANNQNAFHKRFKNKTLSHLAMTFMISCIVVGITAAIGLPVNVTIMIVIGMYILQYIVIEPFTSLSMRYLGNFSTTTIRTKIYTASDLVYNLVRSIIGVIGSLLLTLTNTAYTIIILSSIFTLVIVYMINYMKTRVGLKPEEYDKEDIEYVNMDVT